MADFCKDCSIEIFGEDFHELAGLVPERKTTSALCEGCQHEGLCEVDHTGKCLKRDQ